ncbi:SDR family NAD(P)-dependent oxidoreductase [Actinomadura rubrisoli]|uniref:SDR family NAD(P)-dependent oxidoreductase n=1 Tax=Actinomadura rubrisoli TaxID=2530368 RepID=A0A4R5AQR6_9ACTN|nr:SDR family NAD(P)-dependent oxidoreductase [Actinomadura rubrisoli]TDD75033.1 SDR family NAD(P)-dependent oxidoreductase [Actinomadura rubrisoli]
MTESPSSTGNENSAGAAAGRVVVVTGANGAAGQAVTRRLAADGAHVVAAGRRPLDWDDARITPAVVDLLDPAATRAWAAEVAAAHGRVDGLVHLVGGWRGGKSFAETDLDDWTFLHDQLVRTVQHATLAFHAPLSAAPSGRFAIVSQHAAQHPRQGAAAYATAKAASEAWTLAMADSFTTGSAATILVVEALLTDAMRAQRPGADFSGLTHVDDLAGVVAGLWDRPAAELNGARLVLS